MGLVQRCGGMALVPHCIGMALALVPWPARRTGGREGRKHGSGADSWNGGVAVRTHHEPVPSRKLQFLLLLTVAPRPNCLQRITEGRAVINPFHNCIHALRIKLLGIGVGECWHQGKKK